MFPKENAGLRQMAQPGHSRFKWEDEELVFYIDAPSRLVFGTFTVGLNGRFCF